MPLVSFAIFPSRKAPCYCPHIYYIYGSIPKCHYVSKDQLPNYINVRNWFIFILVMCFQLCVAYLGIRNSLAGCSANEHSRPFSYKKTGKPLSKRELCGTSEARVLPLILPFFLKIPFKPGSSGSWAHNYEKQENH